MRHSCRCAHERMLFGPSSESRCRDRLAEDSGSNDVQPEAAPSPQATPASAADHTYRSQMALQLGRLGDAALRGGAITVHHEGIVLGGRTETRSAEILHQYDVSADMVAL